MLRSALVLALASPLLLVDGPATATAYSCQGHAATVVGTPGDDRLVGTPGPDVFVGRGGDDRMVGLRGDDLFCGGRGSDTYVGGPGDDVFEAGWVDGLSYKDSRHAIRVDRAAGTVTGEGADTIVGDQLVIVRGSAHDDVMLGSADREAFVGGPGQDRLEGGDAGDVLWGGRGRDELAGGAGGDFMIFGGARDTVDGGDGLDRIMAFNPGTATVVAGGGADYVSAWVGDRQGMTVDGGAGRDTLEVLGFDESNDEFVDGSLDRPAGTATVDGRVAVRFAEIDAFHFLGGRWTYLGTDDADDVRVEFGSLEARGFGGDDLMVGDDQDDVLDGGAGTDTAWGGGGTNTCIDVEAGSCRRYPPGERGPARRTAALPAVLAGWLPATVLDGR